MIEMPAATVPALAQPGAILAAAPALAGSEGALPADFSAVLAGAALVAQMPESTLEPEPQPQAPMPIVPELVAASAKPTGKSGSSGKETGKMLPPSKPPVARDLAVRTKAQRAVPTDEAHDEPAPFQDAAPGEQATIDTPVQAAPTAPTPIVMQQTATALQNRASSHDAQQTAAKPAPARPVSAVTRQIGASRSTATAIPAAEQTVVAASLSPEAEIVANTRPANMPMASDTAAVSSHGTLTLAPGDIPAVAARGTSVANLMLPGVAQPSAVPVRTEVSKATIPAIDVATPASARPSTTPNLAEPAAPAANPAQTLTATSTSAPAPALAPTATAPVSVASDDNDIPLQPAPRAMATASLVVPSIATLNLQAASSAIIAPVLPAKGETVRSQASEEVTIAAPEPSVLISGQGKSAIRIEAEITAPVAQPLRDAAVTAAPLPAQALRQAISTTLPAASTAPAALIATVLPVAAPEIAIQQAATIAPALNQPRTEPASTPQPALAAAELAEHKRALPVAAMEAPATVSRPEPISIVTGNDMRTAAIFAAPATSAAATTPTQDIAALVDRITEARAAAAPNTIRAALVHEDFGSVSLNFRSEASHIHVTLGSADPGFAPAVQAAAAANLANNGGDDAQHRRDAPAPQSQQPQDATRNDSSPQQQAQRDRANAGERQPSRQTPERQPATSGERAATATEPRRRNGIFA